MLRKGDLVKWNNGLPHDPVELGIVLEDQKPTEKRVLVYWIDDAGASPERIEWMTPLRKDNEV